MENVVIKGENKKCENCGGNLVFSPSFQSLKCNNCGSTEPIEKNSNIEYHQYVENTKSKSNKIKGNITCKNCGATINLHNQTSKKCPYCNSPYILQLNDSLKPDFVIPFKFDKNRAITIFTKAVKKKFFVPNKFKKKPNAEKIEAFYIPAFSFNQNTTSIYNGKISNTHTTRSGDTIRTYTTSKHISGTKVLEHRNVMVESSSLLNQIELDGILPYDMRQRVKFNEDFIRGYSLEYYVDSINQSKKLADDIIDIIIRQSILQGYSFDHVDYLNVNTSRSNEEYSYGVLPVYKFSYTYGKKNYNTLVNGQTGRLGTGLPISKAKVTCLVLTFLSVLATIICLAVFL